MDQEQATHIASMARHVLKHAQSMVNIMETLSDVNILTRYNTRVSTALTHFDSLEFYWKEIQQVLADMRPRLEE